MPMALGTHVHGHGTYAHGYGYIGNGDPICIVLIYTHVYTTTLHDDSDRHASVVHDDDADTYDNYDDL